MRAADPTYPRVLVVGHNPFTRNHNNGLTLSSLFDGWPAGRLAQLYTPGVTPVAPMFDVCRTFWALTPWSLRRVEEPSAESVAAPVEAAPAPRRSEGLGRARRLLIKATRPAVLYHATDALREALYARPGLFRGAAMREIEAFAPELIFTNANTLGLLRVVRLLAERTGAPVVPFVTDDWVRVMYRRSWGGARLRRETVAEFERMLAEAPVRLVISQTMADEYARRYGGSYLPFTRCVERDAHPATPPAEEARGPIELLYAGQVGVGRWQQLRRVGEQLLALREEGIEARLTIYTTPMHVALHGADLTLEPVMRVAGHVPSDALPALYDAADALLHVESFDRETAEYTALSLSTKLAEYLMAGRAVLGFGPAHLGSMRHIAGSGGGIVAGDDSPEAVRAALRAALADRGRLAELGRRARAYALEHHEAGRERERLRAALAEAAGRSEPLARAG